MKNALLLALVLIAVAYIALLARAVRKRRALEPTARSLPSAHQVLIGFVTNFFDSLGIGNFAPTTVWFRITKMVPDERIPGTMNVGHTLPVMLMGILFIDSVEVESITLISMIASSVVGAWIGAGWVARLSRQKVQLGMGIALLLAALFMGGFQVLGKPVGADALGLSGATLVVSCLGIATLGALMTIGVGLYAPCMVLISLMGMNPSAA
ncbi:MAG: putative membrane protein YfcA, partial [Candidatus Paceibacteria bacterium]